MDRIDVDVMATLQAWSDTFIERSAEDAADSRQTIADLTESGSYAIANVESLARAQAQLAHAEALCAEAEAVAELVAEPRALHRYLSRLVLPAVERVDSSVPARFIGRAWAFAAKLIPGIACWIPMNASTTTIIWDGHRKLTPTEARALAACLLAAADEAEGGVE